MSATPRLVAGVDGGGTKTSAVLIDERGREWGRASAGPCNIARMPVDAAVAAVQEAVELALGRAGLRAAAGPSRAGVAVAGCSAREQRGAFGAGLASLWPDTRTVIVQDYLAAWMGATEGRPGVVVVAGTGAVVYGVGCDGREARADGLGYALGDRGSAHWIGRAALARLLERHHAGRPPDPLDQLLLAAARLHEAADVVPWVYGACDASRLAHVGGAVVAACGGNRAARALVRRATGELARSTAAVVGRLTWAGALAPVSLAGGLWRASAHMRESFTASLQRTAKGADCDVRLAACDPATGAALLALREPGAYAPVSADGQSSTLA
ncbi:MAG TPA: BadF/BadG/BcrA/BcrD ATPase family protein [Chthonomonadales bacterium]|nr:BadF/BadG/BcrA/BcrD ATPase family protein [Chthonomonadales bacterium]